MSLAACRHWIAAFVASAVATVAAAGPPDPILYRYSGAGLYDGAFGPLHTATVAAQTALAGCKPGVSIDTTGNWNASTAAAFKALAACPSFNSRLPAGSPAHDGTLTVAFWNLLVGGPLPSALQRARTLMLTFGATDYTALEWNFCQSRPLYAPPRQPICYSNDPTSFITWGPNGATAGGGREVQAILRQVETSDPSLMSASFGGELTAATKLLLLEGRPQADDTEVFLCGIWSSAARRQVWRAAFRQLGADPGVRDIYDTVYRSASFDGGKIATFERAFRFAALTPTDVDYAFFKDRAAHTSVAYAPIAAAVRSVAGRNVEHWQVRRAIALSVRPTHQRADRLGRDVAYYVDGLGQANLTGEELSGWRLRGSRRASDVGLSDDTASAAGGAAPPLDETISHPAALSSTERSACPVAVLTSRQPPPR